MSVLDWFRRTPPHCRTCGMLMVTATYNDGFDRQGQLVTRQFTKCPRLYGSRPVYDGLNDCIGLEPWACSVEQAAYAAGRPGRGSCRHHSVNEDGSSCFAKDGTPITVDWKLVA